MECGLVMSGLDVATHLRPVLEAGRKVAADRDREGITPGRRRAR